MTQHDINQSILEQLDSLNKKLPNGDLANLTKIVNDIKEDMSEIKKLLLNPETGVIVKTNRNTERYEDQDERISELEDMIEEMPELLKFRDNVVKVLWILFSAIVGIILAMWYKATGS